MPTRSTGSQFIKSIVFGGLDGIITTFAVIATVAGANLDTDVVILMGFANLVADGISMGFGDYLSSKAELEFAAREMRREQWFVPPWPPRRQRHSLTRPGAGVPSLGREFENYPEGERREMVELFTKKGMEESDAEAIITLYSKYPKLYVNLMMYEELGLMPPDEDDNPGKGGASVGCWGAGVGWGGLRGPRARALH